MLLGNSHLAQPSVTGLSLMHHGYMQTILYNYILVLLNSYGENVHKLFESTVTLTNLDLEMISALNQMASLNRPGN